LAPTFISSTPSRALRPLSGLPAAWAGRPVKVNFAEMRAFELPYWMRFFDPGCQCRQASRSLY
jgi:hypothetical protein